MNDRRYKEFNGDENKEFIDSFIMDYRNNNVKNIYVKNDNQGTQVNCNDIHDNYDSLDNKDVNNDNDDKTLNKKYTRKQSSPFIKGIIMLLLTSTIAIWFANNLRNQINNVDFDIINEQDINNIVCPLVMQDPSPFNSIEEADPISLTYACVWYTILSHQENEYDSYDEYNRIVIPLKDVEDSAKILFGYSNNVRLENPSEDSFFEMDFDNRLVYILPCSNCDCYMPKIISKESKFKDTIIVKVGYISPMDPCRLACKQDDLLEPTPEKSMNYILKKDKKACNFYIDAVNNIE